ncbi:MAG: hypothetical protein AB2376_01610 [Clostridium sp.]
MTNMLKATKKIELTRINEIEDPQLAYMDEFYENLYIGEEKLVVGGTL